MKGIEYRQVKPLELSISYEHTVGGVDITITIDTGKTTRSICRMGPAGWTGFVNRICIGYLSRYLLDKEFEQPNVGFTPEVKLIGHQDNEVVIKAHSTSESIDELDKLLMPMMKTAILYLDTYIVNFMPLIRGLWGPP